jgi:hypothetical protein
MADFDKLEFGQWVRAKAASPEPRVLGVSGTG